MHSLTTFIAKQPVRKSTAHWAARFGCSRSHLSGILNGSALPSRDLIQRIETETGGLVPAASWFTPGAMAAAQVAEAAISARSLAVLAAMPRGGALIPTRSYATLRNAGLVEAARHKNTPRGRVMARPTEEGIRRAKRARREGVLGETSAAPDAGGGGPETPGNHSHTEATECPKETAIS